MSEKDDFEAKKRERDSDADDELDEEDDEVESEREAAPPLKKAAPARAASGKGSASAKKAPTPPPSNVPSSRVGVFVVLALIAGAAGGWFGHVQQAKAAASKADTATAPVGSNGATTGPCAAWQDKICSGSGKESAACQQAKGATELLTPSTCQAGLDAMPATLTRIKAARASCDKLVAKLCGDLEPGSRTCSMVKERTPQFPPQRCDEMMKHYDEVIGQLKQMDAQGGPQMGGPGGPGGPGDPGHGSPGHPPH